jgi:hypothetical protein
MHMHENFLRRKRYDALITDAQGQRGDRRRDGQRPVDISLDKKPSSLSRMTLNLYGERALQQLFEAVQGNRLEFDL